MQQFMEMNCGLILSAEVCLYYGNTPSVAQIWTCTVSTCGSVLEFWIAPFPTALKLALLKAFVEHKQDLQLDSCSGM
jgi:hypothetical protein